jgi:hypothetical protein
MSRHRQDDLPTAVDPWPTAPLFGDVDPTLTMPVAGPAKGTIYGLVYELVLTGQPDDQTTYIGKARWQGSAARTMAVRMRGHRSAEDIARDPWKADIARGAAGYRVLERVRCTGDGSAADEAALRRAEADWIDRRRPLHNDVRPVRPRVGSAPIPHPLRVAARPVRPARRPTPADRRARRNASLFLALSVILTLVAFRVVAAGAAPGSVAPWVASPIVGVIGAGWLFLSARSKLRRITRGKR